MKKKSSSRSVGGRALIALVLFIAGGCLVASGTLPASFHPEAAAKASKRTLTLAERVAYQRAIEEVRWRHRIWPTDNPGQKPPLDAVISPEEFEKKVTDYLRKSQTLADYWQQPITAARLQAEMDRMAEHTKQPEVLRELFQALDNDPFVIAECLVRPILAQRLLAERKGGSSSPLLDGKSNRKAIGNSSPSSLDLIARGAADPPAIQADNATYRLPEILYDCADDSWTPTSTAGVPDVRFHHTAVWTGSEMIIWGGFNFSPPYRLNTGGRYNPATDSWTATSPVNAPDARTLHTAVWTGNEMIVWGGEGNGNPREVNTGGRYNPITDSWVATSTANAPVPREQHSAVWTDSGMIVWGGADDTTWFNSGGKYNPDTDSWTATSTLNAPERRWYHTAEWTGSEMIVWGGTNQAIGLNTGGKYNPATDSWTPTSTANAPLGRVAHTSIWSGSEMDVWGGYDSTLTDFNTGGRYNPTQDSWTAISTLNAPSPRDSHTAVWTGSEMIIWGGEFASQPPVSLDTGGRYDPGTDNWRATGITNVPHARDSHTAVWTGDKMIVWGGGYWMNNNRSYLNTGGTYCAQTQAPMAQSAFSRKTHGAAGTFDIPLPLTGNVGIECRSGGATNDYEMIFNFATTVTVGSASVTSGTGSVSSFTVSGSQVTVNLTGVTNVQRIIVTLFNVNDGTHMGNVPVSMDVLVGDVNGNGAVNASDVAQTKSRSGQPVAAATFRSDVNANGSIDASDVSFVKSSSGTGLP